MEQKPRQRQTKKEKYLEKQKFKAVAIDPSQNAPIHPMIKFQDIFTTNAKSMPIDGLSYIPNFLTGEEQEKIWSIVYSNDFAKVIHRRQQFYGEVYYHTTPDITALQPAEEDAALPLEQFDFLLNRLDQFFPTRKPTQILVNEYVGQCGIANHFDDDDAFGDTIVTISLGQPIWLNLQKPRVLTNQCQDLIDETRVLLEKGSLFAMQKDARFLWRHGISRYRWVRTPAGECVYRNDNFVRISLTIRVLLDGRKKVVKDSTDWIASETI